MKALGDHMHSKGVHFGMCVLPVVQIPKGSGTACSPLQPFACTACMCSYSDEGTQTCGGFPGSKGYEKVDADTFASWGVDYLKLDGCYNNESGFATGYPTMGAALQGSGRNITYSCSWPVSSVSDALTTRATPRAAASRNVSLRVQSAGLPRWKREWETMGSYDCRWM